MSEEARYGQGARSLVALAKAGYDAVSKLVVPVDGDAFVTLGEDTPQFPGETIAGGVRHLHAVEVLRYMVSNWDDSHGGAA